MSTESRPAPLRVGLLLDSLVVSQWIHQVIADVQASPAAELALVIVNNGSNLETRPGILTKLWARRDYWLYKAHSRLDHRLFKVEPDAFKQVDLESLLADCPRLTVTPRRTEYSDYFTAEDLVQIGQYRLDVALRFGFRILRGEALQIATYGVWSYHHGDNLVNRGGPPGFWEVMEGEPVTGSVLQILSEDLDGGQVLYRSWSPTHRRSVKRNKNNYYWKSTAFVRRKLEELYESGPSALNSDPIDADYYPYSHRLYQNPTNREFLLPLLKFSLKMILGKLSEQLTLKQWFVAYRLRSEEKPGAEAFYRFKSLIPPKDRYWADPFPVNQGQQYFIFIEEYLYRAKKGHISVIEMDQAGNCSRPEKVLEQPYHLSYPFVFQWEGEYYMIPETFQNRTVELYRCRAFPFEWQLETTLLEGLKAVDATLAEIEGRWWMFVNLGVEGTANSHDELHLFHAPTPLGPWQPHRRNPVKSDCRSARPAGRLFHWQGHLYRPAQDCSRNYGYAISLNKIVQLTPDRFVETEVSRILPKWRKNLAATHTLNRMGNLTVIDGMLKTRKF